MIYQNPHLLYALLAIVIPILIHLFNFKKYSIIHFSSIKFLKEIKEKKKKRSKLKNILILLSRILAITFLVLSFAKPYIPSNSSNTSKDIFIYIDNSLSMDIDYGNGNLLNIAKNNAIEISQSYSSENKFYLITNDFKGQNTSSNTKDKIKKQIEKIEYSPRQREINNIISRVKSISNNNSHLYFISDFQKNTIKLNNINSNSINNINVSLIPILDNKLSNISIDSVFISSPVFISDYEAEINVIISNNSDKNIKDEVLFLYIDEKQKSQQYVSLLSKEKKQVSFKFSTQNNKFICGEIRTNDTPITFDNNLFFTIKKLNKINITTINNDSNKTAFDILYTNDTLLFNYSSINIQKNNYNTLLGQDFIILNEVSNIKKHLSNILLTFIKNGGSILVVPPKELEDFSNYNNILRELNINTIKSNTKSNIKINKYNTKHNVYKNVFISEINKINYPLSKESYNLNKDKSSIQIIGYANNRDFLIQYSYDNGNIYQFSSPLNKNYNNFIKHALFVPTLINLATSSILLNTPYYIIDSNNEISIRNIDKKNDILHIKGDNIDIIPTVIYKHGKYVINTHNLINRNGIYSILDNDKVIDKIAFNYNKNESITSSLSLKEINNLITENNLNNIKILASTKNTLKEIIKEQETGKEYWKITLLLSLLFFAIEIILIKLIKL